MVCRCVALRCLRAGLMKLRKIEILGFKSFRSKTGIEVGDGITAIVGPNGCGKSNIVDAMRWAMGSQSPRDLRGRAMEDVIFAGSDKHKPMGFAEVAITFDNETETSQLPLEWRDRPTIQITRRLYRNGDSDYEINGSRARLRDIHDILAGTGISSKDAYSIIEQGRIGFVVSARPEERRVIIEEAAGITRYRYQRKTAERRLEKTRDNLLRVGDILREVSRQLASLERQAKKAQQHRELSAALRQAELVVAVDRARRAHRHLRELRTGFDATQEVAERAQVELVSAESRLQRQRAELNEEEQVLNKATERAYQLRARCDLLRSNIEHGEREREQTARRLSDAREKKERDEEARERLQDELATADEERVTLNLQLDDLRESITREDEDVEVVRRAWREVNEQMEELREQRNEAERTLARSGTRSDALRSELEVLASRAAAATETLQELREAFDRAVEAFEDASARRDVISDRQVELEERLQLARAEERSLAAELEELRQQLRSARAAQRDEEARIEGLERLLSSGHGLSEGTRAVLKEAAQVGVGGVLGALAERLEIASGSEHLLSRTLGEIADALVVETPTTALALLDIARRLNVSVLIAVGDELERGDIAPWCSSARGVPPSVARRLRETRIEGQLSSDASSAAVDDAGRWTDGEGIYAWRSASSAAESLVKTKAELDRRVEAIAALEERCEGMEHLVEDKEGALEAALQRRVGDEERLQILKDEIRNTRMATEEARGDKQRASRALQQAQEDVTRSEERQNSLREQLDTAEREARQARGARNEALEALAGLEDQLRERTALREAGEARLQELRVKLAGLEATRQSSSSAVERLHREVRAAEERVREWQQAIQDHERTLQETREAQTRAAVELERLHVEAQDADKRAAVLRSDWEQRSVALRELEVGLVTLRQQASSSQRERQELALEVERARGELQRAEEHLVEHAQTTLEAAEREVGERVPDEALRTEIASVKERLARLGAVNPAAEEEYEEAMQRHAFLHEQKEDLEAAVADLEAAIRKMDKTCRELFAETFEQVNEGFQRLFPRLFNGGRGRLELSDPDDLLATGVEIIASPPGKKLQNMTLLSGGEKALTAVALVFAIFELKPSPICVLDEVDAPLDEANVGRFAQMVREISARSQFLIITHNTRTMESADTLYGVTMEEPGVSRLVGVRLRDGDVESARGGTPIL